MDIKEIAKKILDYYTSDNAASIWLCSIVQDMTKEGKLSQREADRFSKVIHDELRKAGEIKKRAMCGFLPASWEARGLITAEELDKPNGRFNARANWLKQIIEGEITYE